MMPELPEVETIKRDLQERIAGTQIRHVEVLDPRVIRADPQEFAVRLRGAQIRDVQRRGKAIICGLGKSGWLVIQLMMTGQLVCRPRRQPDKAVKIIFTLSNGIYLHYNDHRLFGRLQIVEDLGQVHYFSGIGPEPLGAEFTPQWLKERLAGRRGRIKTMLLDHRFVAGIGNIYASEILYQSRINPCRPALTLRPPEIRRLHAATVAVLDEAVRLRGTSMNTYRDADGKKGGFMERIRVYGRDGEPCPRCRARIERIMLNNRSTFFCPRCQR